MVLEVYHPFLYLKKGELRNFGILLKNEKEIGRYSLIIPDEMLDLIKYSNGQKVYYISHNRHPIGCIYNYRIYFFKRKTETGG